VHIGGEETGKEGDSEIVCLERERWVTLGNKMGMGNEIK